MTNQYYGNAYMDGVAMLLNGLGKRCSNCNKPTFSKYLENDKCPVCRGGPAPTDYGENGGVKCDTYSGPCSCGAFH